jgi:hypothetical protein
MWPRFPGLPGKTAVRFETDSAPRPTAAVTSGGNTELARVN